MGRKTIGPATQVVVRTVKKCGARYAVEMRKKENSGMNPVLLIWKTIQVVRLQAENGYIEEVQSEDIGKR